MSRRAGRCGGSFGQELPSGPVMPHMTDHDAERIWLVNKQVPCPTGAPPAPAANTDHASGLRIIQQPPRRQDNTTYLIVFQFRCDFIEIDANTNQILARGPRPDDTLHVASR